MKFLVRRARHAKRVVSHRLAAVPRAVGGRSYALTTGILAFLMAALYFPGSPENLVRRPLGPNQVSAVQYIESVGPIWTGVYAVSAILLFMATITGKRFVVAYIVSAVVWVLYGSAILWSSLLTEPPVPIVTGVIGVGMAWQHIAAARYAKERGSP